MLLTRTAAAERDLSEMWDYIAEDNEAAADRMLLEIDARCALMAEHPKMVRDRSQSQILPDVRSFPVGSYLIFYHETRSGHRDPALQRGDCIGAGQILYRQIFLLAGFGNPRDIDRRGWHVRDGPSLKCSRVPALWRSVAAVKRELVEVLTTT